MAGTDDPGVRPRFGVARVGVLILAALLALGGCAGAAAMETVRRFPDRPAVWVDDDRQPFAPRPAAFYSPFFWDAMDNAFFRGAAEVWTFPVRGPSRNVNAMDEVPDSSWFTNRLSRHRMTAAEVARGPCRDDRGDDPVPKPWRIVAGKPDGLNPGFTIEAADGSRHLLKTDGERQVDRPTAADVIASRLYHAVGYRVPCNRIVYFTRDDLTLDPDAEARLTNGRIVPLTESDVADVMASASPLPGGIYRGAVSGFLPGKGLGPWRYYGTDPDDYNDVFDHRDRRELRALYVMAAWTDHVDARQENTFRTWQPVDGAGQGAGYVDHWLIDFGDCFGLLSNIEGLSPRLGHSGYFDVEHVVEDLLTFGLVDRPWHHATLSEAGVTLAYYDTERFRPRGWRGGYPNPAFEARTPTDTAWIARIVARFQKRHLEAAVAEGRLDLRSQEVLLRVLLARRRKLLEAFLTERSPLTAPTVAPQPDGSGVRLCVEDRLVTSGLRRIEDRRVGGRRVLPPPSPGEPGLRASGLLPDGAWTAQRPATFCADVALPATSPGADPYVVVDLAVATPGRDHPGHLRVHLRRDGAPRVVGIERPRASAR